MVNASFEKNETGDLNRHVLVKTSLGPFYTFFVSAVFFRFHKEKTYHLFRARVSCDLLYFFFVFSVCAAKAFDYLASAAGQMTWSLLDHGKYYCGANIRRRIMDLGGGIKHHSTDIGVLLCKHINMLALLCLQQREVIGRLGIGILFVKTYILVLLSYGSYFLVLYVLQTF